MASDLWMFGVLGCVLMILASRPVVFMCGAGLVAAVLAAGWVS